MPTPASRGDTGPDDAVLPPKADADPGVPLEPPAEGLTLAPATPVPTVPPLLLASGDEISTRPLQPAKKTSPPQTNHPRMLAVILSFVSGNQLLCKMPAVAHLSRFFERSASSSSDDHELDEAYCSHTTRPARTLAVRVLELEHGFSG